MSKIIFNTSLLSFDIMSSNIIIKTHGWIPRKNQRAILIEQKLAQKKIVGTLHISFRDKIIIHLYATRKLKKKETGHAGNCFADIKNNAIHIFLPKSRQTIGFHEMVHILAKQLGEPPLIYNEGLAMWFDKNWHGRNFQSMIKAHYKHRYQHSIEKIISNQQFIALPNVLSYNIAGLLVDLLIRDYGLKKFLQVFKRSKNYYPISQNRQIFKRIFGLSFDKYMAVVMELVQKNWINSAYRPFAK